MEEQFFLSKIANISITESLQLPYFEFEILVDLLIKTMKQETEKLKYTI